MIISNEFYELDILQSFDSSSDTKPRNDDGLLYIDLQFENKPGSRRPIQLVDNMGGGNTPYADIVNPRV